MVLNGDNYEQENAKDELAEKLDLDLEEIIKEKIVFNGDNHELENGKNELADIVMYLVLLVEKLDLDLEEIIKEKIERKKKRYAVDEAKKNGKKYPEFGMSTLKRKYL